ncbi:MAG: hypothetical protein CW691_06840 [Candidatus Bathyarchaeum sp.]|nr:MAG: hypothetical protein CW691_06840 [Candidatus Bathyarchaeum sp.]
MERATQKKLKPVALLYDIRKSVSEILDKPFSEHINHQIFRPDKKALAFWAIDCSEHVLPYFEQKYPDDNRPRKALDALKAWINTGMFKMAVIRKASLDAHAAAKDATEDYAKYAAHAAGQAVATAHVPTHAFGSSVYSIRAVVAYSGNVDDGLIMERNWQLQRLRDITKQLAQKKA